MAKAPDPGKLERQRAREQRRKEDRFIRITISGETRDLRFSALGPGDDAVSRQQAGIPITGIFMDGSYVVGADTALLIWWMARRKGGEPNLSYAEVLAQYPTYGELADARPQMDLVEEDGGPEE